MPWTPIVDGHADTLCRLQAEDRLLCERSQIGHSDLVRLLQAGISLQVLAVCVESDFPADAGLRRLMELMHLFDRSLLGRDDAFQILNKSDLERIAPGRVGFLLGLEGGAPLGGNPGILHQMFRLGLRLLGLVWNNRNDLADGVGVEDGRGLTDQGREIVVTAEDLGMVLDLAHLNRRGFWEVMEIVRQPPVVSHANAGAVCNHRRNLDDDQLRAVAARGGVIGINLYPPFLTDAPTASIDDVLRHLGHMLDIAGLESIALGLDFDGIEATPADLPDITALPLLIAALPHLGLDETSRAAILGRNWLRVFGQILP